MTDDVRYVAMVSLFDSLYRYNQLTALGQDVRLRLHRVWDDARGRSGNITPLGERQHHDIAVRMYRNFPQVFHDSAVVDARSSTSLRCAMSMSYFTDGLKEQNPSLRITRRAYGEYMNYIAYTSPEGEAFSSEQAAWRKDFHAFERRMIRPARLMKSLFLHAENFSEKQSADVMTSLYWIAADMQNVDLCGQVSFYDLFQYDELRDFWRTVNARMYVCNAAAPLNGGVMPRCASNLLNDIVVKADAAISGGSTDADLRFGHDTHLIRLLALMQMEGAPIELYQEFMQDITAEIDRENKIINDLLSLVKMDKTAAQLSIEAVDINELIELVLKRLRPIARTRDIEVVFESIRPVTAEVDEVKITQVFTNLVENAIKYNKEHGWVKVLLDADHQSFTVEISDSGIGIPEADYDHIFERFYRVDKSHSRQIGGTGLGLAIARNAVLLHRGSIRVSSVEGEGTCFTVKIPLTYVKQETGTK